MIANVGSGSPFPVNRSATGAAPPASADTHIADVRITNLSGNSRLSTGQPDYFLTDTGGAQITPDVASRFLRHMVNTTKTPGFSADQQIILRSVLNNANGSNEAWLDRGTVVIPAPGPVIEVDRNVLYRN
jgi:hypothetical protein